jgi:prepilin-type N-terminal cleavage/methylation domain-containing protein
MKHQRRGFTLVEVAVAATLLAALLATSVHMLRVLSDHQRTAGRRSVALEAIQAVAEQVSNLPLDQLSQDAAQQVPIPAPIARYLPGAKLAVSVADETTPVISKRIAIELTWTNLNGEPAAPARLTAWVFPDAPTK